MSYESNGNKRSIIEKDALMRLIAEEMVTSLINLGNGDGDDDEDDDKVIAQLQAKLMEREKARKLKKKSIRRKSKTPRRPSETEFLASPTPTAKSSIEDLYYSHVGGAESPGRPKMPPAPVEVLMPGDEIVVELKDHEDDSFAGGELHQLVDDKHRRPSLSDSAMFPGESEGGTEKSTMSESNDNSMRSQEFSMQEIREYVMANIPSAVREQIPEEAWAQIFKVDSVTSKTASQSSKTSLSKAKKEPIAPIGQIEFNNDEDDDNDDITVFSDVSGLTGAFPDGKGVESKRETLNKASQSLDKVEEASQSSQLDQSLQSGNIAPEAPGENSFPRRSSKNMCSTEKRHDQAPGTKVSASKGTKKVAWDQVEVRYYERTLSDNPSVQSGAGIGIGWKYKRGGRMDVDYWEQSRGKQRQSAELVLPRHVRERILREVGVTQREMADMVRMNLKVKNQRKQTLTNVGAAGVEEAVENARRRIGRLLSLGRK